MGNIYELSTHYECGFLFTELTCFHQMRNRATEIGHVNSSLFFCEKSFTKTNFRQNNDTVLLNSILLLLVHFITIIDFLALSHIFNLPFSQLSCRRHCNQHIGAKFNTPHNIFTVPKVNAIVFSVIILSVLLSFVILDRCHYAECRCVKCHGGIW
jgi:hypothetical protein